MVKSSKYYGVSLLSARNGSAASVRYMDLYPWQARVYTKRGLQITSCHATEREAAIAVDRWNLEHQLGKPLNILKPVAP